MITLSAMNLRRFFSRTFTERETVPEDEGEGLPEIVELEIRDVIDLHPFPPRQVKAVVEEYLLQARIRGFRYVRIIHGRGIGTQRELVRSLLSRSSFVVEYHDAPPEAGGWGATIAELAIDIR